MSVPESLVVYRAVRSGDWGYAGAVLLGSCCLNVMVLRVAEAGFREGVLDGWWTSAQVLAEVLLVTALLLGPRVRGRSWVDDGSLPIRLGRRRGVEPRITPACSLYVPG